MELQFFNLKHFEEKSTIGKIVELQKEINF